jgi:superfamily II DNA/RNA helicase
MERSLDPELLELALGNHERLPGREEFADALEAAELDVLSGGSNLEDFVAPTAWLLHAVASSRAATERYGADRQRAAFRVSAHAFDLILQREKHSWMDQAQLCFAAEIAYLRSDLDPNATAIYDRELSAELSEDTNILKSPVRYSLSCACALLAFDADYLLNASEGIYEHLRQTAEQLGLDSVDESPFGAPGNLVAGCRLLLVFLIYGNEERLEEAKVRFRRAINSGEGTGNRASRWAAAHLLNFTDGLASASIWKALPPDVPVEVRRAFTHAPPKILTLWPPQLDLIDDSGEGQNPFAGDNDRQFITMPTSGGKTLFSHLIIACELHQSELGVCYVAPTRSLCREVRKDLNRRLRFVAGLSARYSSRWMESDSTLGGDVEIEVMTPERLSYLLREDAERVLDQFGLFVFDEVHSVANDERGWTLEQDLAYLHHATKDTRHRILLMSAAVGNRPHFVEWMGGEGRVSHAHTEWRATRRMHAIYTTEPQWDRIEITERRPEDYPTRHTVPLRGVLSVRGSGGRVKRLKSRNDVGELSLKVSEDGDQKKESNLSTANYKTVIPLVNHLSLLGPVLVIQATRQRVRRTAEAIAEGREVDEDLSDNLKQLVELVQNRLGGDHPLKGVLEQRVAYHHGSLPGEIRHGIEDAVTDGEIQTVVATTTMTEGINLPVRSVVVASQGAYREEGYDEYIVGSQLLNAIGRAGRAAKETEGIVVLARFGKNPEENFDQLEPDAEDLQVNSWLAGTDALESLSQFEQRAREAEDAVLEAADGAVSSFISYVWFIAAELERLELPRTPEEVAEWMHSTLAWVQLDEEEQSRWLRAAEEALDRYENTDEIRRRRWARSGADVDTAARLDEIAEEVAEEIVRRDSPFANWTDLVLFLLEGDRLDRVLEASDAPEVTIRSRERGGTELTLRIRTLVKDWIEGVELGEIAEKHLDEVEKTDFRFRQLGDLIYNLFEVHLPWMLRIVVNWTIERLGHDQYSFLNEVPALLRWGVPDPEAARLMSRGVSSRRFAIEIATQWREAESERGIENWVRRLPRSEWGERFGVRVSELRSLASIIRPRSDDTLLPFLRGEPISIPIQGVEEEVGQAAKVDILRPLREWGEVNVIRGEQELGTVQGSHTEDVMAILQMGIQYNSELTVEEGQLVLRLTLVEPD